MDKDKHNRKKTSGSRENLPPTNPQKSSTPILPEVFRRLLDYKDRESAFLNSLNESIEMDCKRMKSESEKSVPNSSSGEKDEGAKISDKSDCELLKDECETFIMPLLNRTGPCISAALVSYDAFEQLNRLHGLLDQMLTIQEQNYQMRRYLRDVRTLCELKKLQKKEPSELLNEGEISDTELDLDNHVSLLSTILAAGNSASTKRISAKRHRERSKSVMTEDIHPDQKPTQIRRQSAFSDSKAKVSKWTKVKAAFKWEKANVPVLLEGKSSDSGIGLTPVNHEVARYLRVPSVPCTGSSADSVLSSSSGHLLSCGSVPATPGTISSASSIEDVGVSEEIRNNRESSKSDSRCDSRINEDQSRRSRSLDGDAVINTTGHQSKNKTPWKKVKDIIQTHRGSFKNKSRSRSIKSSESLGSRDASPCESIDTISNLEDRVDGMSPNIKNVSSSPQDHDSGSLPSSPSGTGPALIRDEVETRQRTTIKVTRKSKILTDFESLPEGVPLNSKPNYAIKHPPSPLNLSGRQDSSDADLADISYSPTVFLKSPNKSLRPRKLHTPGNSSVPSSPSRHSEFFGEFESEDFSSGDFSEPTTPHHKLSPKSSLQIQQEEITEKFLELREKLKDEFDIKRQEWEKIRAACSTSTGCAYQLLSKEDVLPPNRTVPSKVLEENLSADFKKKLHKWRVKKQNSISSKDPQISPTKDGESKKIDWNLWRTGQIKLEGQGLTPLPNQKALPEDFQKKLEQWKKMKETNMVPTYNSQDSLKRYAGKFGHGTKSDWSKKSKDDDKSEKEKQRPERDKFKTHDKDKLEKLSKLKAIVTDPPVKEIEVQTSSGVMKFEGISRKFTRKLYEWEKARGIGPESSTFALLHPGYRPLDVGSATHDVKSHENSPVMGRSLSLDSISPHPSVPSISHQPSSLSLNDMDELKETNEDKSRLSSDIDLEGKDHTDEPEAVIVEVEDDIVETAAPLVTAIPIIEQQTPVYKYEASAQQICSAGGEQRNMQKDFNTQTLSAQTIAKVNCLKMYINENNKDYKKNILRIQSILAAVRESLPELVRSCGNCSKHVRDYFDLIKNTILELMAMLKVLSEDGEESRETISEKSVAIESKLRNLEKTINVVCKYIDKNKEIDKIPRINITSDDGVNKSVAIVSTTPTIFHSQIVINQPKVLIGGPSSSSGNVESPEVVEGDTNSDSCLKKVNRNVSNGSKKKTRLRKMGSRQNSKTESDSSDEDAVNIVLETPRRLKRKTSKARKTSEDEKKSEEKRDDPNLGEDIVYVLKIKPGQVIEQHEKTGEFPLISPTESSICQMEASSENVSNSGNAFVKTKKKIYSPLEEAFGESKTTIVRNLNSNSSSASDKIEKDYTDADKSNTIVINLPPIPQSPTAQGRHGQKITPPKEPSPSIRLMIAKYNQKIIFDKTSRSPLSSGSGSPVLRSPVLDHRVKFQKARYQEHVDRIAKSASAGNIGQNVELTNESVEKLDETKDFKLLKSSSFDAISCNWETKETLIKSPVEVDCKLPLACDSLKLLSKQSKAVQKANASEAVPKKEHIYRKHKEKPTSLFTKTSTAKKIDWKSGKHEFEWRRSISSSAAEVRHSTAEKSNNTGPKITRKMECGLQRSPVVNLRSVSMEPWFPSSSAPTTPSEDSGRPKTPLSERAIKLQKAKEEFLRDHIVKSPSLTEACANDIWNKRLSQVSVGSETSTDDCILAKSASVGVIESGSTDNEHIGGYVSLPRNVSRSGKFSNFGFSTIASKFRKVRMRRSSRDLKKNAVSELCRQSLSVEVTPEESNLSRSENETCSSNTNLSKSGSTQTLTFSTLFKKGEKNNKLDKSKSSIIVGNNHN